MILWLPCRPMVCQGPGDDGTLDDRSIDGEQLPVNLFGVHLAGLKMAEVDPTWPLRVRMRKRS